MQWPSIFSRAVGGLVLFVLSAACNSPTGPGGNQAEPNRNRLEITSATAVAPQQTTEVQAFLVGANGARQDVTARVTWTTSNPAVLSVSSGGRVTGGAVGEATLRASFDDLSGSTTVIVVPAGTFRLAGTVRPSGSTRLIADATIQLITASSDVLTAATGPDGFRFYGVAGHGRLRIWGRGFHPYETEVDIQDHLTHDVSLSAIDIGGSYTLTLSASSRCRQELPEVVRTRTYTATIAQVDGSLTLTAHGPVPYSGGNGKGVFGEANEVLLEIALEEWFPPAPAGGYAAGGRMTIRISAGGLAGFLDGDTKAIVSNEGDRGTGWVTCTAPDHAVVFSR
jgi:hypothetical protein